MKNELSEGWEIEILGDVSNIVMGQSPPGDTYNDIGDGIPFLQGKSEFTNVSPQHIKYTTSPNKIAPEGSVLISVRAPVGDVNIANIDYCIGRGLASISLKDGNNKYLFYVLRYLKPKIESKGTGSTFKAISKSILNNILIPLPPLETQNIIVSILEKAEENKKLRAQADGLSQQLLQSVFLQMFGDPRLLQNTKFSKIKLKDVIQIIVPTRDKPQNFTGNIPWITLPDLTSSIYVEDSKLKLSKEEAKPTKSRLFPESTVILSCAGSLGKVAIAKKEVYTNQQFYGLVCDETKIIPEFLAYHLRLFDAKFYTSISGTSTLAFFKKDSALNIEVLLPDIPKQIFFSKIVQQVETTKHSQQKSSQEIDTLFNALMQKAFNGDLIH